MVLLLFQPQSSKLQRGTLFSLSLRICSFMHTLNAFLWTHDSSFSLNNHKRNIIWHAWKIWSFCCASLDSINYTKSPTVQQDALAQLLFMLLMYCRLIVRANIASRGRRVSANCCAHIAALQSSLLVQKYAVWCVCDIYHVFCTVSLFCIN